MWINLLICGSTNSHSEDKDVKIAMSSSSSSSSSPSSTPRRSRFCKSNNNGKDKNPFATRGLDKFSALLADLEEKRRKIYAENGSDPDISFVRFVYKNTNELVPVVVKLKDNNKKEANSKNNKKNNVNSETVKEITCVSDQSQDKSSVKEVEKQRSESNGDCVKELTKRISSVSWMPSYYLPVVVIFILVLLAVFGRSFAILCTSIAWYVVPTLKENYSTNIKKKKKRDHAKRSSDKRVVSEGLVSSPRIKR